MQIIFGTTNERKVQDLQNVINELNLDMEVLGLKDIGWDLGEIEETGNTIEANSLIKAQAILNFCQNKNLKYPIITDDAGLYCEGLNGEPGIYTARYADDEIKENPQLPKHQAVFKLLKKLKDNPNRNAAYRCCVTCMMPDGTYFQETGESKGHIAEEIIGTIKKPYFYSVFILNGYNVAFSELEEKDLDDTYRFHALKQTLKKIPQGK